MWSLCESYQTMVYGGIKIWLNSSPPGQNGSKNYSWQIWKDHCNYAVAMVRSGTIHPEQYTPECIWSGRCFIAANRMLHVCCDHGKGPLYSHGYTLIPARISNYIHCKMWDGITNPFTNFNSATVEVWEWVNNFIPYFPGHVIAYPCWDLS